MMQYKREVTKEKTHNLPNIVGRVGGAAREDEDEDLPTFKIRDKHKINSQFFF